MTGRDWALKGVHRVTRHKPAGWFAYVYAERGGGQIGRAGPCATKAEALAALGADAAGIAQRYAAAHASTPTNTVAGLIDAYEASPDFSQLSAMTQRGYRRNLQMVRQAMGHLTNTQLAGDVGRKAARLLRDAIAPRSLRDADLTVATLAALCSWGRDAALLAKDAYPTEGLKRLYVAPEKSSPWTQAHIDLAMTRLPPHLSDAIALALHTGFRRTDLCRVLWSAVEEERGVLRWVPSKRRKHRRAVLIRLTPGLRATLARIPKRGPTILTNSHGAPWTPEGLAASLTPALEALGIPGRLHDLRREKATAMAREGESARRIARTLGWSEATAEEMSVVYVDEDRA